VGGAKAGSARRGVVPESVSDLHLAQAGQPGDLPGGHGGAPTVSTILEDPDVGDLGLVVGTEPQPVTNSDRAGEQACVRHFLPRRPAFDLEDAA
jgi:hypothetical protein